MISDTLHGAVSEFDRYLIEHYGGLGELTPKPEVSPFEVEMRIRLDDGNEVSVVERAASRDDLVAAMDRARVRVAMSLARGMLEGFDPDEVQGIPATR